MIKTNTSKTIIIEIREQSNTTFYKIHLDNILRIEHNRVNTNILTIYMINNIDNIKIRIYDGYDYYIFHKNVRTNFSSHNINIIFPILLEIDY